MKKLTQTLITFFTIVFSVSAALASTPEQLQKMTTVNELSASFLSSKLKNNGVTNSMASSVSLYYALSILEGGAGGDSKALIRSFLLKDSNSEINNVAPALAKVLETPKNTSRPGVGMFQLENSIWSTNGATNEKPYVFSEQFRAESMEYYDASAQSLDFKEKGASKILNTWAKEKTNGLILEIIDDEALRKLEWAIMNAAFFEGAWATPMKAVNKNEDYLFKTLDGVKQQAASIITTDYKARVLDRVDGSIAFSLPFVGRKYSLIVYMPAQNETDVKSWLLSKAVVEMPGVISDVIQNRSSVYQLSIQLPKFSFSDGVEMLFTSNITHELGLTPLFSEKADFLLMSDADKTPWENRRTKVGLIKQNTKIELDENGVKAAAVTLIGGIMKATTVERPLPPRKIIVDKPFAFAIVENSSKTILFNGVFVQPDS